MFHCSPRFILPERDFIKIKPQKIPLFPPQRLSNFLPSASPVQLGQCSQSISPRELKFPPLSQSRFLFLYTQLGDLTIEYYVLWHSSVTADRTCQSQRDFPVISIIQRRRTAIVRYLALLTRYENRVLTSAVKLLVKSYCHLPEQRSHKTRERFHCRQFTENPLLLTCLNMSCLIFRLSVFSYTPVFPKVCGIVIWKR